MTFFIRMAAALIARSAFHPKSQSRPSMQSCRSMYAEPTFPPCILILCRHGLRQYRSWSLETTGSSSGNGFAPTLAPRADIVHWLVFSVIVGCFPKHAWPQSWSTVILVVHACASARCIFHTGNSGCMVPVSASRNIGTCTWVHGLNGPKLLLPASRHAPSKNKKQHAQLSLETSAKNPHCGKYR